MKDGLAWETPEKCKKCIYRTGQKNGLSTCNFSIETGKLRNCSVEECPYFTARKRGRKPNKSQQLCFGKGGN